MRFKLRGVTVSADYLLIAAAAAALFTGRGTVLGAAALHEAGHLLALWLTDTPLRAVTLRLWGARMQKAPTPARGAEALILLAGPCANLAGYIITRNPAHLALAACNLLPLRGLDGGETLALFLPRLQTLLADLLLLPLTAAGLACLLCGGGVGLLLIAIVLILCR